jgi:enterochelin esterase family protein
LVPGYKESAAFRVRRVDERHTVEELWRTTDLKGSFGAPVFHEGYLYGFSGDFLTCVSAEDGSKVWKSRAPGGHGLILVDGHLVILGADGAVVAAEASPEGYVEQARVRVFERGSYTYPSFADERIFVRNTRGIAAVSVRRGASSSSAEVPDVAENDFFAFVREVERSDDKGKRIDAFMESQSGFPVVEDDRWVHFIYRGEAEDVAITGSMTEFRAEEPMRRIAGTELFYRSYAIEPGARWEYRFNVDFEHPQLDPLNPRRAPAGDGEMSEVVTGSWVEPEHVRPYAGARPGRVESFTVDSAALGGVRRVEVYLPAGYDDGDRSYPLLVLTDGDGWFELAGLPDSLNHLIGSGIQPIVAAFVEKPARGAAAEFGGPRSADHVRMIADEVVPRLEESYRLRSDRDSRAILGAGTGAMMSIYAAALRPDVFGKAGACSVYLVDPLGTRLIGMLRAQDGPGPRSHFRVIWNRYEWKRAEWDLNIAEDSRRVVEALGASRHDVVATEALDSAGWGAWRVQVAELLRDFFPDP